MTDAYHLLDRPVWRGRLHTWAFAAAIPAGIVLIAISDRAVARVAASIYAVSLLLLFGTSAAYHRLARSPRARQIMQRLDHSMIYVLIAGTYVPICLVVLPRRLGHPHARHRRIVRGTGDGAEAGLFRPGAMAVVLAVPDHGLGGDHRRARCSSPT